MARRIAAVGRVTVSLRKSMNRRASAMTLSQMAAAAA
jgi:hypothetical protein